MVEFAQERRTWKRLTRNVDTTWKLENTKVEEEEEEEYFFLLRLNSNKES